VKRFTIKAGAAVGLGLGLTLALLWLLGGGSVIQAQGPDGHSTYHVALSCTGVLTPCYTTVQAAVDAADDPDDVIKVAAGTYAGVSARAGVTQVVYISKTITIRGGYTTANWTTFDPQTNRTTLDALEQGRVLYVSGDPSAGSGQAISPTIEGLRLTRGDAAGLGGGYFGLDCGGGVYVITATATISSSQVFSNAADAGGGLYLNRSNSTLINNIIADNQANTAGSGLCVVSSSPRLLHSTVARNMGGDGSGVYVTDIGSGYSTVVLTNTILVSHTVGITVTAGSTATLEATLWKGNTTDWGGAGSIITGTVNLWDDPAFVDPDKGDYHIAAASAAVDAGVPAGITTDIDCEARPVGTGYDIGADEFSAALSMTKQVDPDPVPAGAQLTYTIYVTNTGNVTLTATVTDVLPGQVTPGVVLTWTPTITAPGGVWRETVFVTVEAGYAGPLTNVVRVTTEEGATGVYTETALSLAPGLEVSKQADPDPVLAGAQLTYTICVTNTGNVTLTATVTDLLPNQVTPGGILTWTPTITAPGGVWRETVFVTVEAGYAGPLTNVVRVTTEEGATGVYTTTTEVPVTPRLEVSKQADPDPVLAGAQLTYTIYVTNTGNVALNVVMILDTLPLGVTTNDPIMWTSVPIALGGVWTETIVATVNKGYEGQLTNFVYVNAGGGLSGNCAAISMAIAGHDVYLPVVLRNR